jgi:hypothetical protein
MSNKKKAASPRKRHIPRHRKEPSWTVGDLAALRGGLSVKIVAAGLAGATLAIPATSAFASPASIASATRPSSPLITFTRLADQRGAAPRAAQPADSGMLASANAAQAPGGAAQMQAPASTPAAAAPGSPVTATSSGSLTSSDPSAASDPVVATGGSNFSGGSRFLISSGSFPVSG